MTNTALAAIPPVSFRKDMSDAEYQERFSYIRNNITPYNRKRPQDASLSSSQLVSSRECVDYYNPFIAEVLISIRRTHLEHPVDYVFSEDQLIELLRYEPRLSVRYMSPHEMWEVSLNVA